jgi:hypothetical protein
LICARLVDVRVGFEFPRPHDNFHFFSAYQKRYVASARFYRSFFRSVLASTDIYRQHLPTVLFTDLKTAFQLLQPVFHSPVSACHKLIALI